MLELNDPHAPTEELSALFTHPDGTRQLVLYYGRPALLLVEGMRPTELTAIELASLLLRFEADRLLAVPAFVDEMTPEPGEFDAELAELTGGDI